MILSLVWIFTCPGIDLPPTMAQGIILGPYLVLAASAALLIGGVLDTVFGLIAFVRGLKSTPAAG